MPLVLATAFSLSYPSWKTVFSVGRSSFPNTQLNHWTWPSVLWGHQWLSYCQIQDRLPVLPLWISVKGRTCLMTHCFTKLTVLLVYILLLSYCFPPVFLTFPCLFLLFAVNSLCFVYSSNDDIPLSVLSGPLLILYTSVLQVVVDLIFYLLSPALQLAILPD